MLSSMSSLSDATETVRGYVFNKKFVIILILIAIFVGIAFYVYNSYVAPKLNPDFVPNREVDSDALGVGVGSGSSNEAEMYLFAVDWCPYSKKTKPIWDKIKTKFNTKKINNRTLNFIEVDGDKDSKALEKFEDKYLNGKKIDGYPSIYMVKDSQVIEYEAKPDANTLTEFINSVL